MSNDFESLMYLGKLEKDFDVLGHKVKLRTLNVAERLEIAKEQDVLGVISIGLNTKISILSRSIISIDDKPLYTRISSDENETVEKRKILSEKYYLDAMNAIFECYQLLEKDVEDIFEEAKKNSKSQKSN